MKAHPSLIPQHRGRGDARARAVVMICEVRVQEGVDPRGLVLDLDNGTATRGSAVVAIVQGYRGAYSSAEERFE
jgi:hypothetical protein